MLLDINLPKRADQHPVADGGLEILRWLKKRGKAYRPPYIIGTSAYPQAIAAAESDFDNLLWQLVPFEHGNNTWRMALANSIDVIVENLVPPFSSDGVTYRVDVLIVTALIDPELNALWDLPISWEPINVEHDDSSYRRGTLAVDGGSLQLIATAASDKGMTGAAVAVTKGIYSFRPRYVVMTGICAGLERRTRLGDVVITDLCWDWGSGKIKVEDGKEVFHPAPYQHRLDETLRTSAESLKASGALLDDVLPHLPGAKLKKEPRVHIGPVASGASVLQSSAAMKRVLNQHKDLLALEMEIFSVFFACHVAPLPRPKAFALKGVCDFGTEKKKDGHQKLAAAMSARVLYNFLRAAITPLNN
jgi:nucleoside phosphorylase/CheY-like chemotaxis protein